eukprot:s504_g11.t1
MPSSSSHEPIERRAAMEQPGAAAKASRGERSVFPLPFFACPAKKAGVSRPVKQRRDRICRAVENCNEAIAGLNWLAGFPDGCPDGSACDDLQRQVMARVDGLVNSQKPSGVIDKPEAALRSLLRGGTPYDMSTPNENLAPYRYELVSIPQDITGCPDLQDVLLPHDRHFLEQERELMLKPVVEAEENNSQAYWDPALKHNPRAYRRLVKRLHQIGYFVYTTEPKCEIGVFFVWKSSKTKLRMITDARPANRLFRDPPGVSLMTGEGLGRIEVACDDSVFANSAALEALSVFIGLSDVRDCFHRMRVPIWLSRYFAWRPVPAYIVGLEGTLLDGKLMGHNDWVWPCSGSLCQGFSWSLFFAQKANEYVAGQVDPLADARLANDRGGPIVLHVGGNCAGDAHFYVYVDNLGVISTSKQLVDDAMTELQHSFNSRGLELHGSEVTENYVEALGCVLEGKRMLSRCNPKRLWRVHHAIKALLNRGRCSGKALEVVIGHCTFLGLICRPSLSCFHAVYGFIKRFYDEVATMWETVRKELRTFMGISFLLVQDWWRPWNRLVTSSDSSLVGYGACKSWWPQALVAEVGRVQERSRFKRNASHSARESALTQAGFHMHGSSWTLMDEKMLGELAESGWSVNADFPEVPSGSLKRHLWTPVFWGKWNHPEKIGILEARAVLKSLRRLCLTRYGHDIRHLHLCDNLGIVLSVERCRLTLPQHTAQSKLQHAPASRKRQLSLGVEVSPKAKVKPVRVRGLSTDHVSKLLTANKVLGLQLPCTDQELEIMQKDSPKCQEEETESGSTSSEWRVERKGESRRTLRRRQRKPLRAKVDKLMEQTPTGMTMLEAASVAPRAREQYNKRWEELQTLARQKGVSFSNAKAVDIMLVDLFTQKFSEGEGPHYGDYMMAALLDRRPEFSRLGDLKVPRAWRALKGWRKLCPSRSRLAFPLAVWCGLSWRMVVHGQAAMALFNLLQVSTYHRPGSLLKLRRMGLVKPTAGITSTWSMVTSLNETEDTSKVGSKDDSILLDSQWLQFAHPLLAGLSKGKPMDYVWEFSYPEYLKVFNMCAKELKLPVVPYQARHSGPSIDRANKVRDLEEVQKRGGWLTRKSVMRYEKAGRLAASWHKLGPSVQSTCKSAERYIDSIMLGHAYPDIPLPL